MTVKQGNFLNESDKAYHYLKSNTTEISELTSERVENDGWWFDLYKNDDDSIDAVASTFSPCTDTDQFEVCIQYDIKTDQDSEKQEETKTVIVSAHRIDKKSELLPKYDNDAAWNNPNDFAPNGVAAYKCIRRTMPDFVKLSPLAQFLVSNLKNVYGKMPNIDLAQRVHCYNGKTEAQMLRAEKKYNEETTEKMIKSYDLENILCKTDGWLFDIINENQSDEDYWNNQADKIVNTGAILIKIGTAEFKIK